MTMLKPLLVPLLPMIEPTLDLDLTAAALDQRITFTRASTKTYFDSAGTMRTAAVNEWPVEYDPSTVTRVNYLRGSRSLEGYLPTNTALTKGYSVAPDGRADGILVSSVNTGGTGSVSFALVLTPPTDTPLWCWAMLRAGTVRYLRIRPLNLTSAPFVEIDLLTGTAVGSSFPPHFIEPMGNGIYKFGVLYDGGDDNNGAFSIQVLSVPNSLYFGPLDGTKNFEFFGAQAEPGAGPTELIETGMNPTGDAVCLGRSVWEARTNLLTRSQEFDSVNWAKISSSVTANATPAPDGTTTADKLVEDTSAFAQHRIQHVATSSAIGTSYTLSFFAKAAERQKLRLRMIGSAQVASAIFDLVSGQVTQNAAGTATITPIGVSGWFRCPVTGAADATSMTSYANVEIDDVATNYTGDGTSGIYLWGAQLEASAFASPYIPTTSAAVTRSADVAEISAVSSFGYQPDSSTWTVEAQVFGEVGNTNAGYFVGLGINANNDIFRGPSGVFDNRLNVGFLNPVANVPEFHVLTGQTVKVSGSHTRFAAHLASVNGVTRAANLVGSGAVDFAAFDRMGIGNSGRGISKTNGIPNSALRRVRYWPALLTQEEQDALTA